MGDISHLIKNLGKKWIDPGGKTKLISAGIILVLLLISCFQINVIDGKSYLQLQIIYITKVAKILNQSDMPPSYLEFEITERDIMNKFSETKEVLKGIADLGITISLDDFGTGYSSLAYLKYLPNQIIKIDRTFIKDILIDDKDKVITKTAVNMAHLLDKAVVAEGVESEAGIDVLRTMGCDIVQGYYISKPLWELT